MAVKMEGAGRIAVAAFAAMARAEVEVLWCALKAPRSKDVVKAIACSCIAVTHRIHSAYRAQMVAFAWLTGLLAGAAPVTRNTLCRKMCID